MPRHRERSTIPTNSGTIKGSKGRLIPDANDEAEEITDPLEAAVETAVRNAAEGVRTFALDEEPRGYYISCPDCGWTPVAPQGMVEDADFRAVYVVNALRAHMRDEHGEVDPDVKLVEWTAREFRQLINQSNVKIRCRLCGYESPYGTVTHQIRDQAAHMESEHGLSVDAAREQAINVAIEDVRRCPRCHTEKALDPVAVRNSLSRADGETYICNPCGQSEAYEEAAQGRVSPTSLWPVDRFLPASGFQTPDWRNQRSNRSHNPNPAPTPREMPDLRLHLMERWIPGGVFDQHSNATNARWNLAAEPGRESYWEREVLKQASLWWIRDEMVDLVTAAAPSIPADVKPGEVDLPANQACGLAVLEKPWHGVNAIEGTVSVDAIVWGPSRRGWDQSQEGQLAFTFSFYRYLDFAGGLNETDLRLATTSKVIAEARRERIGETVDPGAVPPGQAAYRLSGGAWMWLGRSDWLLSERLDDVHGGDVAPDWDTPQRHEAIMDDRRWFSALCLLVNTRLTEESEVFAARQTRRRAERAGVTKEAAVSTVRIVRLREAVRHDIDAEHEPGEEGGEAKKVVRSHRWFSRGHIGWRRCGPGHSQRKRTYISPSIKGPRDKPLVLKDTVYVWRR